jgi:hypothetical protein
VFVFGSSVDAAVVVVVAEVPGLSGLDALVAAPAVDGSGRYLRGPLGSEAVVCGGVAALLAGAAGLFVVALMSGAVPLAGVEEVGAAWSWTDAACSWHQWGRVTTARKG